MSELPDHEIDALLREVATPEGFLSRLKGSFAVSEQEVEEELKKISVPAVMLARLKEIPLDEWVDRSLASVPVPFEIVWQARKPTSAERYHRLSNELSQMALAAALFIAIGLALFSGTATLVGSVFLTPPPEIQPTFVAYNGPLEVQLQPERDEPAPLVLVEVKPFAGEVQLVSSDSPSIFDIDSPDTGDEPAPGPFAVWQRALADGLRPFDDVVRMQWGVMSYGTVAEDVPGELDSPRLPLAAGIEPTLRGPGREFFLRYRTHPPINPAAGDQFAHVSVPLSTRVHSYLEVQKLAAQNRRPDPRQIRVEDFLAAADYRFPLPAPGTLGIRTAGGPSVFGPRGTGLLQVGVQAGLLPRLTSRGTHLVLAVDLSSSMSRGSRVSEVRQGVSRLLEQLEAEDSVSLVLFQDEVVECVEKASAADKESLQRLLLAVEPHGGTDLAAGLQRAMSCLLADSLPQEKRLVLITDSRVIMPPSLEEQVRALLAEGLAVEARMQILDVSERKETDPLLAEWAQVLGGGVRRATDASRIYWNLLEQLAGRSPVVASETKLTVHFDPRTVAAWRLIGHEANALAVINPPSLDAELKAGEAATVLFEIWFTQSESDEVGRAELTWKDPASGAAKRASQRISRLQFAPSAAEMPLSLQQASIAAQTAEILRGSRDSLRELGLVSGDGQPSSSRGLAGVLAAGRTVPPCLARQPDFQSLMELISRLEKLETSP